MNEARGNPGRRRRRPLRRAAFPPVLVLAALAGCDAADAPPAATAAMAASGVNGIRYLSAADAMDDRFARALEARPFVFPADHASHPEFRSEWWYVTGNVFDPDGRHYGFELTVFRIALVPPSDAREPALATGTVWMGHLAVTDTARRKFQAAERLSRGAEGLAGVRGGSAVRDAGATAEPVVVRIEDWSLTIDGDGGALRADDAGFGIELRLEGFDRIVAQGENGLDRKGPEPGNASYYYSAPRLSVSGSLRSAGADPVAVTGTAWMDREWSTSALSPDLAGWDWFALQLDDGRDLMVYRLRRADGSASPFSGGSLSDAAGRQTRLAAGDVVATPTREWTSPASGVRYPVAWRLELPGEGLELDLEPRLDGQELDLTVRYWEGAVRVDGESRGQAIGGVGYVELAGY